jgi:hypothetical protein
MKLRKFFTDKHGKVVIWQTPNAPLVIWFVCVLAGRVTDGLLHTLLSVAGTAAILVWALLELFDGVNYFRRMLGLVVFGLTVFSLLATY